MMQNPYTAYQPVYGNPYGMRVPQPYYQPMQQTVMDASPSVTIVGDRREAEGQIVSDLAPHFYANLPAGEIYVKQLDTNTGKSVMTVFRADGGKEQQPVVYATTDDLKALEARLDELAASVSYAPKRAREE